MAVLCEQSAGRHPVVHERRLLHVALRGIQHAVQYRRHRAERGDNGLDDDEKSRHHPEVADHDASACRTGPQRAVHTGKQELLCDEESNADTVPADVHRVIRPDGQRFPAVDELFPDRATSVAQQLYL